MHGGATGADDMAGACAEFADSITEVIVVKADWKQYGRAAGPIRNQQMIDCHPDLVLAFHNDLEHSKGTKDCVNRARKAGIDVRHITVSMDADHKLVARRWSIVDNHVHDRQYGDEFGATHDFGRESDTSVDFSH